ncbi:hypothetical protein ACFSQT_29645 [Mesorhizobium calcicola]|uniref:Uncharacterized protein n=1 Tax=Mesorhizobium calcicola TaxID=1300310 RepID=A0ABW4WLZ8_9HYPH
MAPAENTFGIHPVVRMTEIRGFLLFWCALTATIAALSLGPSFAHVLEIGSSADQMVAIPLA